MSEMFQMRAMLGIAILFFVSLFFAFGEMRYYVFGKTVDAEIVQVQRLLEPRRRGSSIPKLSVEYQFMDPDGRKRKETDMVPEEWGISRADGVVAVQYIPGTESSRLVGHTNTFWVYVFLVFLGLMGFAGWRFWKFYKS